jgi:hypothetical protein
MSGSAQARPTGITILAILALIGGVFSVLGGLALVGLGGLAGGMVGGAEGAAIGGLAIISGLIALVSGVIGIAFAYGAWTLKPWGWLLGVAFAILSLVSSGLTIVGGGDIGGVIISVLIAGGILYYLNTPTVKTAFARN